MLIRTNDVFACHYVILDVHYDVASCCVHDATYIFSSLLLRQMFYFEKHDSDVSLRTHLDLNFVINLKNNWYVIWYFDIKLTC